jgi:hypothetical protein
MLCCVVAFHGDEPFRRVTAPSRVEGPVKRIAWLAVLLIASICGRAAAQDARGYVGASFSSNVNQDRYAGVGAGGTIDLGTPWLSAGGQGEALISWPYFAGRGALFGQANVANSSPYRPFVMVGAGLGEEAGFLLGAGVEMRQRGSRYGFRVNVEDYLTRYDSYAGAGPAIARTGHQVVVRGSLLF